MQSVSDETAQLLSVVDQEALGRRIKQARLKAEMTQGELAGGDASVGYVSRIESGTRRPEAALLEKLAKRLGTTAIALLTGAPDPTYNRLQVSLDHAELALRGGSPGEAQQILDSVRGELAGEEFAELLQRSRYIQALTYEADGQLDQAIVELEDLTHDHGPAESTPYAIALSRCYRESGDLSRAIETGERCIESLREQGLDGSDDAIQLAVTVAAAHFLQGDVAHAVRLSRRAVAKAEEVGSPVALASAYWNASVMESERGGHEAAVPLAEKALRLMDSAESNRNLARLRSQMGIFQLRLDPPEIESAKENFEAAARQFEWSSASPVDRGRNSVALARADLLDGSPAEAFSGAEAVLEAIRTTAPQVAVAALIVMGQARFDLDDSKGAIRHYREAVGILSGIGSDRDAAEAWFELGLLLDEAGRKSEAHDAYRNAAASSGLTSMYGQRQRSKVR